MKTVDFLENIAGSNLIGIMKVFSRYLGHMTKMAA